MPQTFQFEHRVAFEAENAAEILRQVPAVPGVFALRGARDSDEPYLTRTADLRRRMVRLLAPPEPSASGSQTQSKRLNLRNRVAAIEYCVTGSEFESTLVLYHAASAIFGYAEARRRLRLHTPYFLRFTAENAYPRVYSTNKLSKRALGSTYGPFPSRAAAERYCDAVLDLFKLRRCWEELVVGPEHPGCAYGEMKRCMAPCNLTCSGEEYAAEARAVQAFFESHGESMLGEIARERDAASAEMEFERAAEAHVRYTRVKAAASLADELVRPVLELRAVIVQAATREGDQPDQAAVFLLQGGCLAGPARLSTLGVRAVKEQTSVGSSLFAQPLMLQAVPLGEVAATPSESPEARALHVLGSLEERVGEVADVALLSDHLSLLRRWYYRPEKQRAGEVFLPNADGGWPVRRILNGAARVVVGDPKAMAETQREGVAAAKVKILHEGRPDVERVVAVVKRGRKPKVTAGPSAALRDDN